MSCVCLSQRCTQGCCACFHSTLAAAWGGGASSRRAWLCRRRTFVLRPLHMSFSRTCPFFSRSSHSSTGNHIDTYPPCATPCRGTAPQGQALCSSARRAQRSRSRGSAPASAGRGCHSSSTPAAVLSTRPLPPPRTQTHDPAHFARHHRLTHHRDSSHQGRTLCRTSALRLL